MSSRIRFWGTIVITSLVFILLEGVFSISVLASGTNLDYVKDNDVYCMNYLSDLVQRVHTPARQA